MTVEPDKLVHRPEQYIGRWAVSLSHELFRIDEARMVGSVPLYRGTGLRGRLVQTSTPTILTLHDDQILEEICD
jgi:hypothetical protein